MKWSVCRIPPKALALLALLAASGPAARAGDWPTFMHDNQRTGVTGQSLRPPLAPAWVFDAPWPPAAGWPPPAGGYGARKNKPNVSYDDAPRVVAAGGACYFCSSGENRVYAIDAATGAVRWTFFTGAAPRLAPACWNGHLYVGADDGVFRCLDARDGALRWQVRAAPRRDLVLGQGRFSSAWPIRAAGIVDEGTVYFTAGLFPCEHLYFYAVDAEAGTVRWCRQLDEGGRADHVPQGYVLATEDSLFTTSRAQPARWSKSDGRPIDFDTPFPQVPDAHEYRFYNGGSYAQVWKGRNIVYGQACILAYDPDGQLKDRWGRTRKGKLVFNWFNARRAVFRGATAYLATDYHVLAVKQERLADLSKAECREFEETYKRLRVAGYRDLLDRRDRLVREHGEDHPLVRSLEQGPLRWGREDWLKWSDARGAIFEKLRRRCAWMTPLEATESLILAGDVLYAGGEDRVVALDAAGGKLLWSFSTGSRVRGLAVANGRLYVSSIDGKVRCFVPAGSGAPPVPAVVRPEGPTLAASKSPPKRPSPASQLARRLVDRAALRKGYCLIAGAERAGLAAEIARTTDFRVELLAADAASVQPMREELAAAGLYGGRVCVRHVPPAGLPYAPYVFNLVIDEGSLAGGKPSIPLEEAFRVTKPCGGVLLLGRPEGAPGGPPDAASLAADLPWLGRQGATAERIGGLLKIARGRIPQAADWTHNYASAANTYSSEDPHVKGPFGILWYGEPGPRKRIDRHAGPPMPLMVGGTVFTIGPDLVMAFDAYNGLPYWEREIPGATRRNLPINTSNLAADDRTLFVVVEGGQCLRLAGRTGKTLKTYRVPPRKGAERAAWAWIALDGNLLYGSRAEPDPQRRRVSEQTSGAVFALDKDTGTTAWTYQGGGIDHDGIAIGAGKLFLVDRALTDADRKLALAAKAKDPAVADRKPVDRRGRPIAPDLRKLVALDASGGAKLWEKPLDLTDVTLDDVAVQGRGGVACMVKDGVVVVHGTGSLGHPHREFLKGEFARRALYALDSTTGKLLWGGRKGYRKRPIIVGDYVYAEPFAWHLKTGSLKTVRNPLSGKPQPLDFHRGYIGCGHVLASASTLFGAKAGIGYCNLDQQCGFTPFSGVALACGLCAVPAGGVLVVPEGRSGCTCGVPIHTSLALYPKPAGEAWGVGFAGGRAEVVSLPVKNVSVNLGAPGYREDARGNLWIPYPARVDAGLLGDWLPTYQHDARMCYRLNAWTATITGTDTPWVFTSGYAHEKPLRFRLIGKGQPPARYAVRLLFAEPEDLEPGQRVFTVRLQGKTVLADFDVAAAARGARRAVVKEFPAVVVEDELEIQLTPSPKTPRKKPVLCGFQAAGQ